VTVAPEGLPQWFQVFRVLQGAEVWAQHGAWVNRVKPRFGAGVKERMAWVATIEPGRVGPAKARREEIARRMQALLADGAVLVLPTVPGIAPLKNRPPEETDDFRGRAMSLLSIAGLARLPQVSLPLARLEGCPLGLSLVAARGADAMLLALAKALANGR
jgi:amidase